MFLRDFYEESDRNIRRSRVVLGLVFLGMFAYLTFIIATCNNQPTQEAIEQSISKSHILSELDRFCQDIPKPPNFKYKFKQLGGNSRTSSISFWYDSNSPFSKVRDFYISYLEKDGWILEDLWDEEMTALPRLLKYRKGKRTVSIERVVPSDADYALGCSLDR